MTFEQLSLCSNLCSPAPGAAALHLSLPTSASGLLQGAAAGQNVSLACNLTACREVTWFVVRDDTVQILLTVRKSHRPGVDTVERHSLGAERAQLVGALELHRLLQLLRVEEADSGLYFCSGACGGAHRVGPGVSLLVGGKRAHRLLLAEAEVWFCWLILKMSLCSTYTGAKYSIRLHRSNFAVGYSILPLSGL